MRIAGSEAPTPTYLYINGVRPTRSVPLTDHVELQPVECAPSPEFIARSAPSEIDIGVMAIFLPQVTAQLAISGGAPKDVAAEAWNSVWDAVLLSALFDCEAVCNFQSDQPADRVDQSKALRITNYHLRGLTSSGPRILSADECAWAETHLPSARALLETEKFQTAVHALASYRWNPHPRVRLAVLWAGIEALFGVDQELAFRLSLYTARFLAPADDGERQRIFAATKKLYRARSAAVHGSPLKAGSGINDSAALLSALVRECVTRGSVPEPATLAP